MPRILGRSLLLYYGNTEDFSEIDTGEKLYSVLLSESEMEKIFARISFNPKFGKEWGQKIWEDYKINVLPKYSEKVLMKAKTAVKGFSNSRENLEREFLRKRSEKNEKTSNNIGAIASIPICLGTAGLLGNRIPHNSSDKKSALMALGSWGAGILTGGVGGHVIDKYTKTKLDTRDYLKAKRLTDKELKENLKTLKDSSKENKLKEYKKK